MILQTAYKFLKYDKSKSIGALIGVIVSTFLIGQQVGVFIFLIGQMKQLVEINQPYIWVVDDQTQNVNSLGTLDMRINRELLSIPGVANSHPLFISGAQVQFRDGKAAGIQLVGVRPPEFAGAPKEFIQGEVTDLLPSGAVSVDRFNEGVYKTTKLGVNFEINNKRVYTAAKTEGVNSFAGTYSFTTIDRARALVNAPASAASAFLVETGGTIGKDSVVNLINNTIYGVRAWRSEKLARATVKEILSTTGIAISFGTLIIFAFIAGFFIIGLILYSAAIDRIKDYGTIKAIGATNGHIRKLIYSQAAIFSVVGFAVGLVFMFAFKFGVASSGILFSYPLWLLLAFFFLITGIAVGGATFAVRRVTKVEPAEAFKM